MFAIALLTLKRMREPAFFIFLGIALVMAFIFAFVMIGLLAFLRWGL